MTEGPEDPFQGRGHQMAISLHEMFTSFIAAGFTEAQAMSLVNNSLQTLLTIGAMVQGEEDDA